MAAFLAFSCTGQQGGTDGDGTDGPDAGTEIKILSDRSSVIRNPMTGWVMYVSADADPSYFDTEFYVSALGKNVKVRDYASCFYVRTGWKDFNPEPGKYFWDDPDSKLYRLWQRGQELGLPMAFRVVVDGRDQGENTPEWVFEKGAQYWLENPDKFTDRKVPNVLDETWREWYETFIEAFAEKFNDPDKIAFIDGYGLGKWGEGHNVCYEGLEPISWDDDGNVKEYAGVVSDNTPEYKENTMKWITGLYSRCFTKVPLVINYHRQIGHPRSTGAQAQPDSEHLLQIAIDNGYCLRADSFGMLNQDWGYNDWEREFVKRWNYKLPIILEGGYVIDNDGHQSGMEGDGYHTPAEVRKGEFDEGKAALVNMMDFRTGGEVRSWFEEAFTYVEQFIYDGGYRFYPDRVSVPQTVVLGDDVSVSSRWVNLGWGYCPVNLRQWDYKYKLAYALLDMKTEKPLYEFVDEKADLSKWLNDAPVRCNMDISMKKVPVGAYIWAVGIVDMTKVNENGTHVTGLNLSVNKDYLTQEGWVKVTDVRVE